MSVVTQLHEFEERLRESEAALATARHTVEELEPRVASLRLVVQGLRGLVPGSDEDAKRAVDVDRDAAPTSRPSERGTYGGRPNLPVVLRDILGDFEARKLDEIVDATNAYPAYVAVGYKPSRGSITNRLNDMAHDGMVEKLPHRRYRLLPEREPENPVVPETPNPGVQLDGEKPPAEEVIAPRLGHPYNLEGATGVVHRPGI